MQQQVSMDLGCANLQQFATWTVNIIDAHQCSVNI